MWQQSVVSPYMRLSDSSQLIDYSLADRNNPYLIWPMVIAWGEDLLVGRKAVWNRDYMAARPGFRISLTRERRCPCPRVLHAEVMNL